MIRTFAHLLVALLLLLPACGGGEEKPAAARAPATDGAPARDATGTDDAQADENAPAEAPPFGKASLRGKVTYSGDAPRRRRIDIGANEFCTSVHPDGLFSDTLVIAEDGAIANVFVQIKDGLPRHKYETPAEPVELDQIGCTYVPHLVGVQLGQKLLAVNSDPVMHNVHGYWESTGRDVFNFAQSSKGVRNESTLRRPGLIHVKCEVHSWMGAWVHVVRHPFFSVTGEDGAFAIERVPPGTYEVEAWHEKLGTRTQTVEVGEDGAVELSFTFEDE